MSVVFPGLQSPDFATEFEAVEESVTRLESEADGRDLGTAPLDASGFDEFTEKLNRMLDRFETLDSYVGAFVTTDSRDEAALARASELDALSARVRKLLKRFTASLGASDAEALIANSATAREHEYVVRRAQTAARRLMSPDLEGLASDLELTGTVAWSRLHGNVTSQMSVTLDLNGEATTLPMSMVRGLASDPDREKRRSAYEAEIAAWRTVEVPLAAAMNSIKGEVLTLSNRRGWESPLDAALFAAAIDRPTLNAMMAAAVESFPDFRRYLRAKARKLGLEKLAWYDLAAPLSAEGRKWEYEEACDFVATSFDGYSARMGDFARRNYREAWIDAEARPGKVDGAYCMPLRADESRILMNFRPSFNAVSTLAHELGHGYHNLCLAGRPSLLRDTPMTLAETASIFCETVIREASIEQGSPEERLAILEASLQGACGVVVDITSRFLFESSVFEMRAKRELSPQELNERMERAQRDTYGDGLDEDTLHPFMWAAKPHYYSGASFYNFPYMFGLLFALGLYAIYRQEGDAFKDRYDALLGATGTADAATLAARFGIDIRTPDFWRGSLDRIRADIDRFESLVA